MTTHNPHYAPPAPRNGLGLAALILGIVALPLCLTGLTAWLAIILGIIAVPLAIAGLARVRRGTATNRAVTIAGLVLGVVGIAGGIASTVVTIQAVDDALSGPTATVVQPDADPAADAVESTEPVALGTTLDVDGLKVTVTEIGRRTEYGKGLTCANVSYTNGRDEQASRNPFDWSARNPQGASVDAWIYTGNDALDSGELAPGGTDDGIVCFDVPRAEVAVVEYAGSFLTTGPDAEWNAR